MANNSFRDSVNSLGWSRRDPDLPVRTGTSSNTPFLSRLQSYNPFGDGGYVQLPTHNDGPGAPLPAASRREEEEGFFALSRWDRMLIFGACNLGAAVCFMLCFFLFPVLTLKPRKFAVLWSVGSMLFLISWAVLMGPWTYAKHLTSGSRLPFTAAYFGSIALTLYFAIGYNLKPQLVMSAVGRCHFNSFQLIPPCTQSASLLSILRLYYVPPRRGTWMFFPFTLVRHIPVSQSAESRAIEINLCLTVPDSSLQSLLLTLISSIFQIAALVWYLVSYFPMGSTGLQYVGRFGASRVTSWISG
ncbi:hypothetical protein N7447_004267 [Penicillium robsamsonii]|uniref:uncharacterized protein n=1 Tax=Penicillium robsamsonii TaxID=1792511 RepID=UPI0025496646|nr:uncharacterized protein N7447_004267 [Penicillium robsamsonii]KAJ5827504.1 hypothetical protein N7447_004267 [Penicillium robsamsonii]